MTNDPVMIAYSVKRTTSGKSVWTPIGRAYPHDEGSGLTVVFDALPLTKRIVLLDVNDSAAR
jgi:hypothetical protein